MSSNLGNRLVALDYARWIFALLVVIIHVPLIGKKFLSPIACCAVPFFYMATGYFLYDKELTKVQAKIIKALKNYGKIWIVAFSILTTVVFGLKIACSNPLGWSLQDFIDLFLVYGNCQAAELLTIDGVTYGTSALWFLYGGIISLALLLCLRRFLFSKVLFTIVLLLYYISIAINYRNGYVVPRVISASFIFLYIGLLMHKINVSFNNKRLLFLAIATCIGLYLEQLLFRCESYNRIFLLPTSVTIFMLIISCKDLSGGNTLYSNKSHIRYLLMA